jgi:hypothetical protein
MKTLTLEEAVTEVVKDFVAKARDFSAHEVTTAIRNMVNTQVWEISGVPYGYVDATNTHSQMITHSDVRDIVKGVADDLKLRADYNSGHRVFLASSAAQNSAPVSFVGNGAPAASTSLFSAPPPAASTGIPVPQRFTCTVKDEVKQKITRYVRSKLTAKEDVNLHMVQSTIKAGLKLPEIEQVIKAEGWVLVSNSGASRSYWTITE